MELAGALSGAPAVFSRQTGQGNNIGYDFSVGHNLKQEASRGVGRRPGRLLRATSDQVPGEPGPVFDGVSRLAADVRGLGVQWSGAHFR